MGVILPRTGNGFCGGERVCLGQRMVPLEDLPQPVLEPTISLESSRERTAVAGESFELKLLQRQYPYDERGQLWQTLHQCVN